MCQVNRCNKICFISIAIAIICAVSVRAEDNSLPFDVNDQEARLEYQRSIPITIWPDNVPGEPMTYEEWKTKVGEPKPFEVTTTDFPVLNKLATDVGFGIFINADLYPQVEASINQYIADLNNDGYDVKIHFISGGQPAEFRALLTSEYYGGMEGCILIGDLPVPWYETNCWDSAYASFPIDLYYMDLDGIWEDTDADGMFDDHYGDMGPEIWMGRLVASTLTFTGETEAQLIDNYFTKNHRYRTGQNFLNNRGLAYVDDDWEYWANQWSGDLGLTYPTRTTVSDGAETVKLDYEDRLTQNYESVLLCCHSGATCHSFKIGDMWTGGSTCYTDIVMTSPTAHFFNLFACSNSRFVETNYMGGWYIFYEDNGIAAIGCTKTGSMLYFNYFYGPFGAGRTFGEAFMDWFNVIASWGFPQEDLCWFYGMSLSGDPTLKHLEPDPVQFANENLNVGNIDIFYCDTILVTGGIPPYSWSVTSGSLPSGLSLDTLTGEITGVPENYGNSLFTISVNDNLIPANNASAEFNINVSYLCGDANNEGAVNILDIVYLISYTYKGGPAPDPFAAGDVNGTQTINILDITYMIAFLYQGGDPLICLY